MAAIATWTCWAVVIVTWIAAAARWARKPRGRHRDAGTAALWRLASVVIALLVYRLARHDLDGVTDHSGWLEVAGLVLLVAATGFTIWARLALGGMWSSSPNVLQAAHRLRTDGPYGITRHPIYTGLLGMLLGTVLANGFGASLTFVVIGAAVLLTRIPVEERLMSETFPDEYARYRRRVPRLVPGIKLLRRPH